MVSELQRLRERLFETSPNLQVGVTPGNSLADPKVSNFALSGRQSWASSNGECYVHWPNALRGSGAIFRIG
jgi:hypothetical protein